MNAENVTYFVNFPYVPKEIRKLIGNKNVIINIYRIQALDSVMCGWLCIGFIDFMLKAKSLVECTNLFSTKKYKKNEKVMLRYFH